MKHQAETTYGGIIERKTVLIPEMVAQMVVSEFIIEKYPDIDGRNLSDVVDELTEIHCNRADILFNSNMGFKKQILKGNGDRDALAAFFTHWTEAKIKTGRTQAYKYDAATKTLNKV